MYEEFACDSQLLVTVPKILESKHYHFEFKKEADERKVGYTGRVATP